MCSNWLGGVWRLLISKRIFGVVLLALCLTLPACEGFLGVGVPESQLARATAFENEGSARSAVLAIYAEMISSDQNFASGGSNSISVLAGLSADELIDGTDARADFQHNDLQSANSIVLDAIWAPAYKYIYYANAILEGLEISSNLADDVKKPLEAEARFLRAFVYFYLTNLFDEIPLILGTDYETNNVAGKVSGDEVYEQILVDLTYAEENLPSAHDQVATYGRARADKYAAKAMLSRVYLFQRNWSMSEKFASEVINSGVYYLADIAGVFLAHDNQEAIWQLMSDDEDLNITWEGAFFLAGGAFVTDELVSLFATDAADQRQNYWLLPMGGEAPNTVPFKYVPFDHESSTTVVYSTVLRLAELYLIRAEDRVRLGDLSGAVEDLNKIRVRAEATKMDSGSSQDELLVAIAQERQKELFSEWGHRWLDLKRTGSADGVLSPIKGVTWQSTDVFYPIPESEIAQNPNLGPQNDGY